MAEPNRRAISLLELVVVFVIIAFLGSLIIPKIELVREKVRRETCQDRMRRLGRGLHEYEQRFGSLPYGSLYVGEQYGYSINNYLRGREGELIDWNWVTAVMPFVGEGRTKDKLNLRYEGSGSPIFPNSGSPTDPKSNRYRVARIKMPGFICPSDERASNPIFNDRVPTGLNPSDGNPDTPDAQGLWYTGSMGPTIPDQCTFTVGLSAKESRRVCMGCSFGTTAFFNCALCFGSSKSPCIQSGLYVGMFARTIEATRFEQVTDGLSHTFMVGETLPAQMLHSCVFCNNFPVSSTHIPLNNLEGPIGSPVTSSNYWRASGFKSSHPGGANIVLGDGSVRFVSTSVDYFVWNEWGTTAGGEMAGRLPAHERMRGGTR